MERNWNDFKSLHSNIAGAREAFEDACETLYRKIYPQKHVSQVKVKQGDGGIDIFIGELGIEPITVIQCKFFLETFDSSQKAQIRDSFDTAINSGKFQLKEWLLCIPRVIDIDENSWWFKWKDKKIRDYNQGNSFIKLVNGNELIDLFKQYDLYNRIFKIDDSLKIAEIHAAVVLKENKALSKVKSNNVLFNNYTLKCEPFYFQRHLDLEFIQSLEINNIWLFGKSGVGKTVLITRNLIQNKISYCFCDLSPITINTHDDVLEEILCSIEEEFSLERNAGEKNKIKQIIQLLKRTGQRRVVILIDELSTDDINVLKAITDVLIKLVTYFYNQSDRNNLKFVISTINNPTKLAHNKSKASDYFQYLCCDYWENYLENLFDLITNSLSADLNMFKSLIISESKNNPRTLKMLLRKIIMLNEFNDKNITNAIEIALDEIVD